MLAVAACDRAPDGLAPAGRVQSAVTISAPSSVMSGDSLRSGFFPNQPALDPAVVGSPFFGQIFDATLVGQIYAQPLYAGGVLLVATEENNVYGLDPVTGQAVWQRQLGAPFNAADLNCGDLTPSIGVTGTPAIDVASGTAYLLSKTYANGTSGAAIFYAHALDLATGAERDGFPVAIAGAASNDPTHVFDPERQHQRPGLLLMNGVVYAAFGAHCDERPYAGWVVGISTSGHVLTLWSTQAGAGTSGAGIWQAGGGLVSDGDGQILFATGNDWSSYPGPVPGKTPPGTLGESVVRLSLQANGTLAATDFFSPATRDALNNTDSDFGSGAPVALPASFGTPSHPNLLAQIGKSGILYLLDRDDLGGYQQGDQGADRAVQEISPLGPAWSKPSAWPGDGGYLYVPVVEGCDGTWGGAAGCLVALKMGATAGGTPALAKVGRSSSSFAYGASAAVVTSDGLRSGSALVWTVWSSGWTGVGGEVRAYDAVPENGTLPLRFLAEIGTSAKFTAPAVGDGRIYVGTRDGHVFGYGATGVLPLRAQGLAFPATVVGAQASGDIEVTAAGATTIVSLAVSGDFALGADAPAVPLSVAAGGSASISIAFRPTTEGAASGSLVVTTDAGTVTVPLSGVGQSTVPKLSVSPGVVTFGPIVSGQTSTQTVTITNVSDGPMPITEVVPPASPFSVSGMPDEGAVLAVGSSITATITYAPTQPGTSSGSLSVASGDATAALAVAGSALMGGKLRITPQTIDLGSNYTTLSSTTVFQLTNEGDMPVTIEKSKPPTSAAFQAVDAFGEGTSLAPGASIEQLVVVAPKVVGVNSDVWQINADDGQGLRLVTMTIVGIAPPGAPATTMPTPTTTTTTTTPTTPPPSDSAAPTTDTAASATTDTQATTAPPAVISGAPGGQVARSPDPEGCSVGGVASCDWGALGGALAALALARRRRPLR